MKSLDNTAKGSRAHLFVFDSLDKQPRPPIILGKYGRREWDHVMPGLYSRGVLLPCDMSLLTAYCMEMESYYEALNMVNAGNEYTRDRRNRVAIHPAVRMGNKHLKNALELAREFGIKPSSKTRITVGQAK